MARKYRSRFRLSGLTFLLVTLLVLMAAWNTGEQLFYVVVGGLLSFWALTLVFASRNLRKLTVTREAPHSVEREQEFFVTVRVENHKPVFPALSLRVETEDDLGESAGYILRIPARKAAELRVRETFAKRGVYQLPALHLVSRFPFGLMEHRSRHTDDVEVLVHPRVTSVRMGWTDQVAGSGDSPQLSDVEGDEYYMLREYVPGDDLRRIAWRVSARLGQLIVRELEPDMSRFVIFLLETYDVPEVEDFEDRFEEVIEMVASLAVTLLGRNYAVSVVTPTLGVPLGEGRGHAMRILDMLARVQPVTDARTPFHTWPSFYEPRKAAYIRATPDPSQWGLRASGRAPIVLDPREVIRA